MANISILTTEPKHLRILAENMRAADKAEIEKFGYSVNKGLWRSYKGSLICKTIFVDGELAAVFGLGGDIFSEEASPWLLTTSACEKVSPLTFTRIFQQEVLNMLKYFPRLANHVDAEYNKAVKLLENCGFTIGDPEPMGENGAMYRKFSMTRAS